MNPILRERSRLLIYLGAWFVVGDLVGLMVAGPQLESLRTSILLCFPMAIVFGFICLAVWYPCRATPVASSSLGRLAGVHIPGALVSTGIWLGIGWLLSLALDRTGVTADAVQVFRNSLGLFFALGILLFLLAVLVHYLLLAFEASRRAESEALEAKLLARQAELDAFKAQIDPHFLFNCLNSISSLCGRDPQAARRTAVRLGDFLRSSLELGSKERISLGDELDLARAYLEVEQARFGDRLRFEETVDPQTLAARVPALMLQPLLENALKHGVAHLLEGGRLHLASRYESGRLTLTISNSCDPERPQSSGTGIGLENVRGRLRLLYGDGATMRARDEGDRFEVEVSLPAAGEEASVDAREFAS